MKFPILLFAQMGYCVLDSDSPFWLAAGVVGRLSAGGVGVCRLDAQVLVRGQGQAGRGPARPRRRGVRGGLVAGRAEGGLGRQGRAPQDVAQMR